MPKLTHKNGKPVARVSSSGREQLAVNLFDLDRVDPIIRQCLRIAERLDADRAKIIKVDADRMDETGVAFTCDLLTAASICDVLREHDRRAGDHPTRVYLKKVSAWEKLPHGAVLTQTVDGGLRLNPAIFASRVSVQAEEPEPERVEM